MGKRKHLGVTDMSTILIISDGFMSVYMHQIYIMIYLNMCSLLCMNSISIKLLFENGHKFFDPHSMRGLICILYL